MQRRGQKTLILLGGIFLVLAGVVIGSFLVLRSATSQGEFYAITSDGVGVGEEIAQSFLSDLYDLQEKEFNSTTTNLTQRFLDSIARAGEEQNLSQEELVSEEFFTSSVLPFLKESASKIFINIADEDLIIEPLADKGKYIEEINTQIFILAGTWQKINQLTVASVNSPETKKRFEPISQLLALGIDSLKKQVVPANYVDFHKRVLTLATATQTIIVNGITKENNDPLRGLLAMASLEKIQELGREVVIEFSQIETNFLNK
jgi:hypothetical protein